VFSVLVVRDARDVVLQLSGTLDGRERAALSDCIEHSLAEEPRRLVLELSGLEDVDTDGADAVRAAADLAGEIDVELVLQNAPSVLRPAFEGCGAHFR
jgi:anti-anti-sigma regulatory factor